MNWKEGGKIPQEILAVAVKAAVDLGLIPRVDYVDDIHNHWKKIELILLAALQAEEARQA